MRTPRQTLRKITRHITCLIRGHDLSSFWAVRIGGYTFDVRSNSVSGGHFIQEQRCARCCEMIERPRDVQRAAEESSGGQAE